MKNNTFLASLLGVFVGALIVGGLVFYAESVKVPTPGSIPGSSIDGNYFSVGGVQYYYGLQSFAATSSSVCVIPNPFGSATSTVVSFNAQISSSSATGIGIAAQLFDLSTTTATGGYGSSTPAFVRAHSVAAGAKDSMLWTPISSSTPSSALLLSINSGAGADGSSPFKLGPSEKLTYRIASGTPATFSTYFVGQCEVLIRKF